MFPTREDLDRFFDQLGSRWSLAVTEFDTTVEYEVSKEDRKVLYSWDPQRPEEMSIVFGFETEWELEDWTEMFESEEQQLHFEYLGKLAERYLEHSTRLRRTWYCFGHYVLQYNYQGNWYDIRNAI